MTDAMRERHWKKLMRICGKTFVMDDKLNLGVLLGLELHKYAEPVGETVEQARMELKIDKQLNKIETTWMALQLEYEPFKTTGVTILKDASATIEALDDHEVALQTMMGNRFMAFFENSSGVMMNVSSIPISKNCGVNDWIAYTYSFSSALIIVTAYSPPEIGSTRTAGSVLQWQ